MRLQAIRRPGKHEHGIPKDGHDVGIADTLAGTVTWWRTHDLALMASELETGGPHAAPESVDTAPLFLVCTHGRHDACCARWGIPLVNALHAARPGQVWETTHLSGDRFAANVLVLPGGELYGRVPPESAVQLADAAHAGNVLPAYLRGRIGLAPFAQTALVYAYERLAIASRAALTVRSVQRLDPNLARVDIETPSGIVAVTVAAEANEPAQLTCRGPHGVPSRAYRGIAIEGSG
jgi:hypothetical protein